MVSLDVPYFPAAQTAEFLSSDVNRIDFVVVNLIPERVSTCANYIMHFHPWPVAYRKVSLNLPT